MPTDKGYIFLDKIDSGLDMSEQSEQPLAEPRNLLSKLSSEMALRDLQPFIRFSLDRLEDCFSLGQIHSSIEECAFRKFPRLGKTASGQERGLADFGADQAISMAMNFNNIFPRIGSGGFHVGDEGFVDENLVGGIDMM